MRTEEYCQVIDYLFPYEAIKNGEEIALCGAGNVCRAYMDQLHVNEFCKVKDIYDSYKAGEYLREKKIKSISDMIYDENITIVIAIEDKKSADEVGKQILRLGYHKNQIIWNINKVSLIRQKKSEVCVRVFYNTHEVEGYLGKYILDYWRKIRGLLRICGTTCGLVRVGASSDGGYLMANEFDKSSSGVAYSFGIADDVSWDESMADRGYEIYMYDHTIPDLPKHRPEFHFIKKGIADSLVHGEDVGTLESMIINNGHENKKHMILKVDVEGAEYGFIDIVDEKTLEQFDQIVFELHGVNERNNSQKVISLLEKLSITHTPIHVHANNWGDAILVDQMVLPDVLEVTFMIKESDCLKRSDEVLLPHYLDAPNCPQMEELKLGKWRNDY